MTGPEVVRGDDASQSGLEEDARDVYRFVGREVPMDVLRISPPV
jgi:hypothetical protein